MNKYISFRLVIAAGEIAINKNSVYRLLSYEGIEAADISITTATNAAYDGGYIQAVSVAMRTISITFSISDKSQTEVLRKKIIAMLKPKVKAVLYVSRGGVTRRIYGYLSARPEFYQANMMEDRLHVTVTLLCPDPYFLDERDTEVRFLSYTPTINFPLTFLPSAGLTSGIIAVTDTATIINGGENDIGIICEIDAAGGPLSNPKITLDGGDYVRVVAGMELGDVISVNTRPGEKDVTINGESVFLYDKASVFFSVPPGEHTLKISADTDIANARTKYIYSLKYLGV